MASNRPHVLDTRPTPPKYGADLVGGDMSRTSGIKLPGALAVKTGARGLTGGGR